LWDRCTRHPGFNGFLLAEVCVCLKPSTQAYNSDRVTVAETGVASTPVQQLHVEWSVDAKFAY